MLTKQLLQTAFLKLLKVKPIHAISIRELCAEAGINRTTFYYHYGSQYDLLEDISGRFLDSIARCLKDADGSSQEGIQQRVTLVLRYIEDNLELSTLLMNNSIDPTFAERLFSLQQITYYCILRWQIARTNRSERLPLPLPFMAATNCSATGSTIPSVFLRNCKRSGSSGWQDAFAAIRSR